MSLKMIAGLIIVLGLNCSSCKKHRQIEDLVLEPNKTDTSTSTNTNTTMFKNMLGINGFEWEFVNSSNNLDTKKVGLINTFSSFRHYLDWEKIEPTEGGFNLTFYDQIYKSNIDNGIKTLLCLQIMPSWMRKSYSEYNSGDAFNSLRDYTPVLKGADKSSPSSYIQMARAGFQIAARYGKNSGIDKTLLKVPSYEQSAPKYGLNLLEYIECSNEPDKDWKGSNAQQTPEQYAAQLSAFYDGHMGTLGKDVGVKTADPQMKVVMAGLADPNPDFVARMIAWCKTNRVKDGKYTLCFDVINYHQYSNENWKVGKAPELSNVGPVAASFVKLSKDAANSAEVWVTECGFDVNAQSPQRAIAIGSKTAYITQADWILRTSLLYARTGISRTFFFMLNDVNINDPTQYSSSGLIENDKRRASADYILQVKKLMGDYAYKSTISTDPIVDIYTLNDKSIYVLTIPDQKGRTTDYSLNLGTGVKSITLYTPKAGADDMTSATGSLTDGKITIKVSETPTFVQVN